MSKIDKKTKIILCISAFAIIGFIYVFSVAKTLQSTITDYNNAVERYNSVAEEYNLYLQKSCVDNIDGMLAEVGILNSEDDTLSGAIKVVLSSNSKEKIEKDIQTINELVDSIEIYKNIAQQITVPEEAWVIDRLKSVSVIENAQASSKMNDPAGLLGKDGGYKSCIYFSIDGLDVSQMPGKSVVEKGTDGGGAIEVYANLEDAEARCDYLAGFDGTILYSGSYAIVGTMVVRTSYLLTEEDQLYLTNEIVKAFTEVKDTASKNEDITVDVIDTYRISSSLATIDKKVTDESEIKSICDFLKSMNLEKYDWSMTPVPVGGARTVFEIHLSNGEIREIEFADYFEKGFRVIIDSDEYIFQSDTVDLYDFWNDIKGETEGL